MKMADVKVGMRLRSTIGGGPAFSPITVTEITERGFKYRLDADVPFIAREGSYFPKEGGEHYGRDGETFYEVDAPAMTSPPVEQRGDFKEWNYTETHLPVRRIDEHNACVTALRAALARGAERRMFPIQQGPAIPWSVIAPCEDQAQRNHGQSIKRLAERGGLSPCEAVAVLRGRQWHRMDHKAATEEMLEIVRQRHWQPILDDVLADAARLREALRELAIMAKGLKDFRCGCCDSTWQLGQPENHAPGCLAVPPKELNK